MCLKNGGNVAVNATGAPTTVGVGGTLTVEGPNVASAWRTAPTVAHVGWTNATSAFLATTDANRTTRSLTTNTQSGNLDTTGFFVGANIPATAIIRGIQVEIVRRADNTLVDDESVRLLKAGVVVGDEQASGTDWPTTDGTVTYDGSTNALWGTTWTPAQINASNFGVRLRWTTTARARAWPPSTASV